LARADTGWLDSGRIVADAPEDATNGQDFGKGHNADLATTQDLTKYLLLARNRSGYNPRLATEPGLTIMAYFEPNCRYAIEYNDGSTVEFRFLHGNDVEYPIGSGLWVSLMSIVGKAHGEIRKIDDLKDNSCSQPPG
jgi:hypothetical protein